LIEQGFTEQAPGFISVVAMAETVCVLERAYGIADADIATAIERTLQVESLVVENEQEVFTAMVALKEGRGSFADALIGALGARAGCSRTLTFDQKALGFRASRRREGSSLAGAPVLAWHRHRLACSTSVLLLHQSPSRTSLALCTH
jgi:predicted nucleic-acid-binding protein